MLISALTVHGGRPATCQHRSGTAATQADTTRPPMSTELNLPQDAVLTVAPPGDPDVLYYRNIVGIAFVENASGRAVRAVLRKYHAMIIGGDPYEGPWGAYIVRIPDPGPTMDALGSLLSRIEAEPAVAEASWVTYRDRFVPRTSSPNRISADTAWPVLTTLPLLDTSRVVSLDTFLLFRTDINLRFKAGIPDSAKRAFFIRHSMTVVGVTRSGMFYVRIPDPGPRVQQLWDALETLRRQPEVDIVSFIPWSSLPESNSEAAGTTRPAMPRHPE